MPIARRADGGQKINRPTPGQALEEAARGVDADYRMIRSLLIEARGAYSVWGAMLRGPTPIEELRDADLAGLVRVLERFRAGNG